MKSFQFQAWSLWGKALPISHGSEAFTLVMAVSTPTLCIHSGLYSLRVLLFPKPPVPSLSFFLEKLFLNLLLRLPLNFWAQGILLLLHSRSPGSCYLSGIKGSYISEENFSGAQDPLCKTTSFLIYFYFKKENNLSFFHYMEKKTSKIFFLTQGPNEKELPSLLLPLQVGECKLNPDLKAVPKHN